MSSKDDGSVIMRIYMILTVIYMLYMFLFFNKDVVNSFELFSSHFLYNTWLCLYMIEVLFLQKNQKML